MKVYWILMAFSRNPPTFVLPEKKNATLNPPKKKRVNPPTYRYPMMQKNPPPMRPSSKSNCMRNTDFEFCTIKVATSLSSMTTQMFVCFFYAQLGSSTRQTAARFGFLNQKLRTAKALKRRNPIRSLSHQVGWQKRFQQIRGIFVLMCLMC